MKKVLTIVLMGMALAGCSKYVAQSNTPSAEDMNLTGTAMSDTAFSTCVDRVWPEKKLNQEIRYRYADASGRISKMCRRFGNAPDFNDFEVCCKPLK